MQSKPGASRKRPNYFLFLLEILFYVLTDYLNFAVRSLFEFVDNQMRVVLTEVIQQKCNPQTDKPIRVTLTVSATKQEFLNGVVTNFRPCRLVVLKRIGTSKNFVSFLYFSRFWALLGFIDRFVRIFAKCAVSNSMSMSNNSESAFFPIVLKNKLIVLINSRAVNGAATQTLCVSE